MVVVVDADTRPLEGLLRAEPALGQRGARAIASMRCRGGDASIDVAVGIGERVARAPELTPYDPIIPTQDLNEKNPQNTAAARMSEGLDLSAPDRVDDQVYNRILWLMLKGEAPPPAVRNRAPLHTLAASR